MDTPEGAGAHILYIIYGTTGMHTILKCVHFGESFRLGNPRNLRIFCGRFVGFDRCGNDHESNCIGLLSRSAAI